MAQGEASIWQPSTVTEISGNTKSVAERFVATDSQTNFTLITFVYALDTGALEVHKNGLLLAQGEDWVESTTASFTLLNPATVSDEIIATGKVGITGNIGIQGEQGEQGDPGPQGESGVVAVQSLPFTFTALQSFDTDNNTLRLHKLSGNVIEFRMPLTQPKHPICNFAIQWAAKTGDTPLGGITYINFGTTTTQTTDPAIVELITGTATVLTKVITGTDVTWTYTFDGDAAGIAALITGSTNQATWAQMEINSA